MSAIEWNKKEDLLQDQALRHLKQYTTLFAAFATTTKSEIVLLNKIQEYCYENMNFLKSFNKIVLLLYKSKLHFVWKFGNFILMKNFSIDLNDTLSTDLINFTKIKIGIFIFQFNVLILYFLFQPTFCLRMLYWNGTRSPILNADGPFSRIKWKSSWNGLNTPKKVNSFF